MIHFLTTDRVAGKPANILISSYQSGVTDAVTAPLAPAQSSRLNAQSYPQITQISQINFKKSG